MDEENTDLQGYRTAGNIFGDDAAYTEFCDLIYILWQLFYCSGDFKQAMILMEAQYRK